MDGVTYNNKSILEKYDSTPTANSNNLVNSGVVKQYVDYEVADIRSDVDDMIDRVGNPFVFKGTKATISALPSSGNTINDCWFVEETGFIYCWNGTEWSKASTDVNDQLAHCIAEEYSDQKIYKQGELVIYNNAVYVRKSDATTQEGTFVSANWTQTNIGNQLYEEVTNLKSATDNIHTAVFGDYSVPKLVLGNLSIATDGTPTYYTVATRHYGAITPDGVNAHFTAGQTIGLTRYTLASDDTVALKFFVARKINGEKYDRSTVSWNSKEFTIPETGDYCINIQSDPTTIQTDVSIFSDLFYVKDSNSLESKTTRVSFFPGAKISILGDSIETFDSPDCKINGYRMYYPSLGVNKVNQTWWKRVIDASEAKLEVNASWSGSRVTNTDAHDPQWPDFYDRVSSLGNPDVIFVALGTNDSSNNVELGDYDFTTAYTSLSEAQFRPAYIKGIKALRSEYPNAQIVCVIEQMQEGYKASIMHIATTLGVMYIDASDYIGESGVHPGVYGMRQISSHILYPLNKNLDVPGVPPDAKMVGNARDELTNGLTNAVSVMFESGTIQSNGSFTDNSKRLRTSAFIQTKNIYSISVNSGYIMYVAKYNESKQFMYLDDTGKTHITPSDLTDCDYVKIVIRCNPDKDMSISESTGFICLNNAIKDISDRVDGLENEVQNVLDLGAWKFGHYTYNSSTGALTYALRQYGIVSSETVTLHKGNVIGLLDYSNYYFNVYVYDNGVLTKPYTNWFTIEFVTPYDMECIIEVKTVNSETVESVSILSDLVYAKYRQDLNKKTLFNLSSLACKLMSDTVYWSQGACLVGDTICGFSASNDDGTNTAGIKLIDAGTLTQTGTAQHNLGHCNSADYNSTNDILMVSNAYTAAPSDLLLFVKNASSKLVNGGSIVKDTDALIYPVTGITGLVGCACFGEAPNIIYIVATESRTDYDNLINKYIYRYVVTFGESSVTLTLDKSYNIEFGGELQGCKYTNGGLLIATDSRKYSNVKTPYLVYVAIDELNASIEKTYWIPSITANGSMESAESEDVVIGFGYGIVSTGQKTLKFPF